MEGFLLQQSLHLNYPLNNRDWPIHCLKYVIDFHHFKSKFIICLMFSLSDKNSMKNKMC